MKVLRTIDEARAACQQVKRDGRTLGLVPTMGALHQGHLSLVRGARAQCGVVAVSIFVNPLQFGPNEDFARYPRSFERDCRMLEAEGVSLVFAPTPEEMYGPQFGNAAHTTSTYIEVPGLSDKLEGKTRPGHFRGVTTVVAKLFHIIEPDVAFFGQKDAQQVVIIRRMVEDLNMPVRLVVCPIVREADGLALSSRNAYLDPAQRNAATVLHRALMRVQAMTDFGERDAGKLAEAGRQIIREEPLARLDYFELVDPATLDPVSDITRGALVVTAVYFGSTRLIDNLMLYAGEARTPDLRANE
ncbi:MAG: pantoate--beta-alanine ligase [Terriglobales bacterium]